MACEKLGYDYLLGKFAALAPIEPARIPSVRNRINPTLPALVLFQGIG